VLHSKLSLLYTPCCNICQGFVAATYSDQPMALHDKLGDPVHVHSPDALIARPYFPSKKVQHSHEGSVVVGHGCILQLVLNG
jgi:hypothetical protein